MQYDIHGIYLNKNGQLSRGVIKILWIDQEIKRQVQQNRENDLLKQIEEITAQGYKWDGLKKFRAKFSPSYTKFKDLEGNHVPFQDFMPVKHILN